MYRRSSTLAVSLEASFESRTTWQATGRSCMSIRRVDKRVLLLVPVAIGGYRRQAVEQERDERRLPWLLSTRDGEGERKAMLTCLFVALLSLGVGS